MARLEEQLAALETMSLAPLRTEWGRVLGEPAPALVADTLRLGIAFRLQERVLGKLPAKHRRMLATRSLRRPAGAKLRPGTQLVRSWNGRSITVFVEEGGYLFDGDHYASLSAIARQVTGAHWSGPRFFGLGAAGG